MLNCGIFEKGGAKLCRPVAMIAFYKRFYRLINFEICAYWSKQWHIAADAEGHEIAISFDYR